MRSNKNTPLIGGESILLLHRIGEGSNQFQDRGLVTSSLTTTRQKFLRLRGKIVLTVGNTLSLLNWRHWLGGSLLLDKYTLKRNLLRRISTILQSTTQDVKVSRFHISDVNEVSKTQHHSSQHENTFNRAGILFCVHVPQNILPHLLQWCRRFKRVNLDDFPWHFVAWQAVTCRSCTHTSSSVVAVLSLNSL